MEFLFQKSQICTRKRSNKKDTLLFFFFVHKHKSNQNKNISEQTNLFFEQENRRGFPEKIDTTWKATCNEEIYIFVATIMLMSHVKKPRISDYWSTNEFIATPIFTKLLSRNWIWQIWMYLHFNDNNNAIWNNWNNWNDCLHKIVPVLNFINSQFKKLFSPYQNLCLDESLMLYKGRLAFKQYIPSKRHRFGIKSFILCDCKTGYILNIMVYVGKETKLTNIKKIGISGSIVMQMMQP